MGETCMVAFRRARKALAPTSPAHAPPTVFHQPVPTHHCWVSPLFRPQKTPIDCRAPGKLCWKAVQNTQDGPSLVPAFSACSSHAALRALPRVEIAWSPFTHCRNTTYLVVARLEVEGQRRRDATSIPFGELEMKIIHISPSATTRPVLYCLWCSDRKRGEEEGKGGEA